MAKVPNAVEILLKIAIGWVGCTSVTDDKQTTDRRTGDSIANVNVTSRSLKIAWILDMKVTYQKRSNFVRYSG